MKLRRKRENGFSLLELVIVVVVTLIVAAMATPDVLQTIYNVRLRSSAYELSGIMQATRTQAVRDNKYYYVCYKAIENFTRAWISSNNACSAPAATDQQIQMAGNVSIVTSGAPSGLSSNLSFTAPAGVLVTAKPAFNARGLPCYANASRCDNIYISQAVSYVLYLAQSRPIGSQGWAALSVSPAGRMEVWIYGGSIWAR